MQHTHDIEVGEDVVRKTFVSWADGEPEREWAALQHLDRHAPDIAPRPISRFVADDHRPGVVMSRLPGEPLTGHVTTLQAKALAALLQRLFSVPVPDGLPVRGNDPLTFCSRIQPRFGHDYDWALCEDPDLVKDAADLAAQWLDSHEQSVDWIVDPVVAVGDGNLDNVIWDGQMCRMVDWEEFGASDLAYEVSDVVEHASSRLEGRLDGEGLLGSLNLSGFQRDRVVGYRRIFASFWLSMLLPGNSAWLRNPPGSVEKQARHVLRLIEV